MGTSSTKGDSYGATAVSVVPPRTITPPYRFDDASHWFGSDEFCIYRDDDDVFHKFSVENWPTAGLPNLFHGMTLGELHSLMKERVWTAGRYTPPSKSSPLAIWGCTTVGMALDRAAVARGWARTHDETPTGWDCPVVLGIFINEDHSFGKHKELSNGSLCMRKLVQTENVLLETISIVTIYIPRQMFARFNHLRSHWKFFQSGVALLCRTKQHRVNDFWKSGHGNPWSCGRWVFAVDARKRRWRQAKDTLEWRCPWCEKHYNDNVSVVGVI